MPRFGHDASDWDTDFGTCVASEFRKRDGTDVPGYAGIECERGFGRDWKLYEPGGDGGEYWSADMHDDYVGVCGFLDRVDGIAILDGNADCAHGECWGQLDEDCDDGVCEE